MIIVDMSVFSLHPLFPILFFPLREHFTKEQCEERDTGVRRKHPQTSLPQ